MPRCTAAAPPLRRRWRCATGRCRPSAGTSRTTRRSARAPVRRAPPARGRSASRGCDRARAAIAVLSSAGVERCRDTRPPAARVASPSRGRPRRCPRRAPPLRAARDATSCPAPNFFDSSWRHVPNRSIQPSTCTRSARAPSTVNCRRPAIVAERRHRRLSVHSARPLPAIQQHRRDDVVPVGVDVGVHHDRSPTVRLIGNRPPSTSG